jgi:hypothetical protein
MEAGESLYMQIPSFLQTAYDGANFKQMVIMKSEVFMVVRV